MIAAARHEECDQDTNHEIPRLLLLKAVAILRRGHQRYRQRLRTGARLTSGRQVLPQVFARSPGRAAQARFPGPTASSQEGSQMKYLVSYEYKIGADTFTAEFAVESEREPTVTDGEIIECALKDSVRFARSGLAAIVVISISAAS